MLILNGGYVLDNQIDLGKIYGIEGMVSSAQGLEPKNFLGSAVIPSLEQIAEYNLASRGLRPNPQSNQMFDSMVTVPQINSNTGINDFQDDFPSVSTPTTTLNASMNMSNNLNDLANVGNTSITDFSNPFPVTSESIQYLNGFIRTQIGRRILVTFLIGSNMTEEKEGYLLGVGANYILMNELDTDDLTACDFYNIKFIKFFY